MPIARPSGMLWTNRTRTTRSERWADAPEPALLRDVLVAAAHERPRREQEDDADGEPAEDHDRRSVLERRDQQAEDRGDAHEARRRTP